MNQLKYKWMKISVKIDQIFQGNLNRQIMKLPWTVSPFETDFSKRRVLFEFLSLVYVVDES